MDQTGVCIGQCFGVCLGLCSKASIPGKWSRSMKCSLLVVVVELLNFANFHWFILNDIPTTSCNHSGHLTHLFFIFVFTSTLNAYKATKILAEGLRLSGCLCIKWIHHLSVTWKEICSNRIKCSCAFSITIEVPIEHHICSHFIVYCASLIQRKGVGIVKMFLAASIQSINYFREVNDHTTNYCSSITWQYKSYFLSVESLACPRFTFVWIKIVKDILLRAQHYFTRHTQIVFFKFRCFECKATVICISNLKVCNGQGISNLDSVTIKCCHNRVECSYAHIFIPYKSFVFNCSCSGSQGVFTSLIIATCLIIITCLVIATCISLIVGICISPIIAICVSLLIATCVSFVIATCVSFVIATCVSFIIATYVSLVIAT